MKACAVVDAYKWPTISDSNSKIIILNTVGSK